MTVLLEIAPAPGSPVRLLEDSARMPHILRRPFGFLGWCIRSLFGIVSLILALAILAAIPGLNFIALGYLLEAEGRVARSGRFRDAVPLIHLAPRLGAVTLGIFLWLLPIRLLAWIAEDAAIVDPGGRAAARAQQMLVVASILIGLHVTLALARGGKFTHFFRPIRNLLWFIGQCRAGDYFSRADLAVRDFVSGLRLKHLAWLGFRGFVGAAAWLVPATLPLAALTGVFARTPPEAEGGRFLLGLLSGIPLVLVLSWVPFLEARFAAENRLGAFRELSAIRQLFRRAPLCWLMATVVTYAFSLPMYFATIALPPRDALWMVAILDIVLVFPARMFVGWTYHQAARRERPAWLMWRWPATWVMMPALAFYVFLLFFTQFIGQHGRLVLFQHPALLLPVPW